MSMVDQVFEELRSLPEFELQEVLDFVEFLKTQHGLAKTPPANDGARIDDEKAERADWAEFEKLAGTWSGKFNREDCLKDRLGHVLNAHTLDSQEYS
jgi:hypothetical protein